MSTTTNESAPMIALTHAAIETLTPITHDLRSAGWDANLKLTQHTPGDRSVSIEITLAMRVPIELEAKEHE